MSQPIISFVGGRGALSDMRRVHLSVRSVTMCGRTCEVLNPFSKNYLRTSLSEKKKRSLRSMRAALLCDVKKKIRKKPEC